MTTPFLRALLKEKRFPFRYQTKFDKLTYSLFKYKILFNKYTDYRLLKLNYENKPDLMTIYQIFNDKEYFCFDFSIKKSDTIIDIGANIGSFSIYAANLAKKGKVYSYEPDPRNFRILEKNKKLNKQNNLLIFQKGIIDSKKTMILYYKEKISSSNSMFINKWKSKKQIKVDCISLPDIFKENKINHCNLLKIDSEGAEYDIVFNTPKKYFYKIDKILLEFHNGIKYKNQNLIDFLKNKGFKKIKINYEKPSLGVLFAQKQSI